MAQTLTALFLAHVLADYVLQTGWMVRTKRRPTTLLFHTALVLATAMAATGQYDRWEILALGGLHLLIDAVKSGFCRDTVAAHLFDQAAHLATIAGFAMIAPDLWTAGAWGRAPGWVPHAMILLAGAIYATRAGGFAVGKLMRPYAPQAAQQGLEQGGLLIGLLERGLIYMMIMVNQPAGIGFLIAAKSLLRFEAASKEQKAAEYVIIGTLASFGWAMLVAYGTQALRDALPPLEILPPQP